MTVPAWLPAEFHAECDRLAVEMLGREPNDEAAELLAVCAIVMERWRAVAALPPTRGTILAADSLLQLGKFAGHAAVTLVRQ